MKRTSIAIAVLSLVVAGCSKSATPSSNPSSSSNSGVPAHMTAVLAHLPIGSATVEWSAKTKTIIVKGILTGLAPNSTHPMHIHTGSCEKQGGVIHPLKNVVANASGVAVINASVAGVKTPIPTHGWYLNVHTGPTLANAAQFRPIACVDLAPPVARLGMQLFSKSFSALPGFGNNVNGSATFIYSSSAKTLSVVVTLNGLDPNSVHASHVHAGSCEAQGKVVYPLKNVKADAKGAANVTTVLHDVIAPPSGPMYVNIHSSTDLRTQVGFTPISCGNLNP